MWLGESEKRNWESREDLLRQVRNWEGVVIEQERLKGKRTRIIEDYMVEQ